MINLPDRHLTAEQIEEIGEGGPIDVDAAVARHVNECPECSAAVETYKAFAKEMGRAARIPQGGAQSPCPPLESWASFHSGNATQGQADDLMAHLVTCEECAAKMSLTLSISDEEPVRAATPVTMISPARRWISPAIAAAIVIGIAAGGWHWWTSRQPSAALVLIADAASEQSPGDFYFPGARYASSGKVRGPGGSPVHSKARDEARLKLDGTTPQQRSQLEWQRVEMRLELLDWNYRTVIDRGGTVGNGLEMEMGIAYLEKAEAEHQPADYQNAIELFSRLLQTNPRNKEALFDRALAYEGLQMYHRAVEDYQGYLKLDPDSGWSGVARQKISLHEKRIGSAEPPAWQGDRAREYLFNGSPGQALLPTTKQSAAANDPWIADFLQAASPEATLHLRTAIKANEAGDPHTAETEARQAIGLFRNANNVAGELRAGMELSFALQRQSEACLAVINAYLPRLPQGRYEWLRGRMLIQRSTCALMAGDFALAMHDSTEAEAISTRCGFSDLGLAAIGTKSKYYTELGKYPEAATNDLRGLGLYWSGSYAGVRAQVLFYDLMLGAASASHWHAAEALALEAADTASQLPNKSIEAFSRGKAAEFAARLGDTPSAQREYRTATRLFAELPDVRNREYFQALVGLGIAEAGGPSPVVEVADLDPLIPHLANQSTVARYLNLKARLLFTGGKVSEAERYWNRLSQMASGRNETAWQQEHVIALRELVHLRAIAGDTARARALWRVGTNTSRVRRLVFVEHPRELIAFTEEPGQEARMVRLPVEAQELRKEIANLKRLCSDPASEIAAIEQAGARLYGELIAPLDGGSPSLEFVTDGDLDDLPWNVILTPNRHWFAERTAFSSLPGMDEPRVREGTGRALIVSDPAIRPEWVRLLPPLPETRVEAEAVRRAYPGAVLLAGDAATSENVLNELPKASVFHFAGHSLQFSGGVSLMLASQNGMGAWNARRLTPSAISACALAVLSACSTSWRDTTSTAGESLVRDLLQAGVPQVIASRWSVDSAATSKFMASFYAGLAGGLDTLDALRRAQSEIRSGVSRHPYYWAAFELFGRIRGDLGKMRRGMAA